VKFRWVFTIIFIVFAIFSAVMIPKTNILYDLSTYTPKGGMLDKSIALMREEFDDKGSVSVMFAGVTPEEAESLMEELSLIEGVQSVSFNPQQDYKNSEALFSVILSDYDSTEGANATIELILEYMNDKDAYLAGQSAAAYYTRQTTENEILTIAIIVAVMVICILLFTSKTYFELVVMLLVFGIAAIINIGTNFLFGKISYISNFIGMVLQLVLTIDYSVILLHRFLEEREMYASKEAATVALGKSIPEILSSSLTTIAGMCALILMTLPIGKEMGLALTKGIAISIFTVMFFMTAMLVFFDKPIARTKHKYFVPKLTKLAKKSLSARYAIIAVFVVITTLACMGQIQNTYSFDMNASQSIISQRERISQNFGTMNTLVVIIPNTDVDKEKELTEYVLSNPVIDSVISLNTIEITPHSDVRLKEKITAGEFAELGTHMGFPSSEPIMKLLFQSYIDDIDPDNNIDLEKYKIAIVDLLVYVKDKGFLSEEQSKQIAPLMIAIQNFESENYTRIMFNIDAPVESSETFNLIDELMAGLERFYGKDNFYLVGESVMTYEMNKAFPMDKLKVVLFTSGFIMLILLLTLRNLLLPFIMMIVLLSGIWINFALPFLMGNSVMFISYLVITAIQMGATIDYAIILTNRFQSVKLGFQDIKDAVAESVNSSFPTIITSGIILTATGLIMGSVSSEPIISSLGMLLGIGTLLSITMVLFVLPQLLFVFNKLIDKAQFRFKRKGSQK